MFLLSFNQFDVSLLNTSIQFFKKNRTDSTLLKARVKEPNNASKRWYCVTLHKQSSCYAFLTSAQEKKVYMCMPFIITDVSRGECAQSPVHSLPRFPIPIIYTTYYFWHQLFRRAQKTSVCTVTGLPLWANGHPTRVSRTPESFPFQLFFFQMLETESRSCQTAKGLL